MTSADFTLAASDATPTGRKLTINGKSGIATSGSGTANWAVLDNGATILYITSTAPTALVFPGTANFGSWKIELLGPT